MGVIRPGQGFVIKFVTLATGSADQTAVISRNDTEIVSGAYLALTGVTSTTVMASTGLGTVNGYVNRVLEFTSSIDALSALNVGQRRIITAETLSTGAITLGMALPQTPQVGDKFKVLSPVPRGCSKIYFCGATGFFPTAASRPADSPITLTCADGWSWGYLQHENNSAVSPFLGIPVEVDLAAHGDCTVFLDATAAWAAATTWHLHFYAV